MSTAESMECQEENIPEKMECSEGLNINEILSEAKRKLLKYQRKKWSTEQEDLKERFITDVDEKCPECQALMVNNFQCLDATRYIFQCCQCKSYFIPDGEPENVHKRRKTEWAYRS